MAYWIFSIIIILALAVMAFIVLPKFPKISLVDLNKAPLVQQANVKRRIIEQRLGRHIKKGAINAAKLTSPLFIKLAVKVRHLYKRLVELEEWYRHKALQASFKDKISKEQYTGQLIKRAEEDVENELYEDAERKYLEVLKLDEKNPFAYKGLGELYFIKKDFDHAREVFEFYLRMSGDDASVYRNLGKIASSKGDLKSAEAKLFRSLELDSADLETYLDLAEIYLNLDEPRQAFSMASKAVVLEPNNPRALDFLLQISIIIRDKEASYRIWRQLREANPENKKLIELKRQIDKL